MYQISFKIPNFQSQIAYLLFAIQTNLGELNPNLIWKDRGNELPERPIHIHLKLINIVPCQRNALDPPVVADSNVQGPPIRVQEASNIIQDHLQMKPFQAFEFDELAFVHVDFSVEDIFFSAVYVIPAMASLYSEFPGSV